MKKTYVMYIIVLPVKTNFADLEFVVFVYGSIVDHIVI